MYVPWLLSLCEDASGVCMQNVLGSTIQILGLFCVWFYFTLISIKLYAKKLPKPIEKRQNGTSRKSKVHHIFDYLATLQYTFTNATFSG